MAEREQCVLTNMCMIYQGDNILVQRRAKKDWERLPAIKQVVERCLPLWASDVGFA